MTQFYLTSGSVRSLLSGYLLKLYILYVTVIRPLYNYAVYPVVSCISPLCLHQAFTELHNIHDSFSRIQPFWHFTKPLSAYFCLCACIRHMPEQDNWPNGFLCFCSMLASDIRPNCADYQCLCLPLYLWRFYAVPIYMCIYMFASGIYPNCTAYPVVNTHLLEIFSLLGTF